MRVAPKPLGMMVPLYYSISTIGSFFMDNPKISPILHRLQNLGCVYLTMEGSENIVKYCMLFTNMWN